MKVTRRIGLAHSIMDVAIMSTWHCRYLCRRKTIRFIKSPLLLVSLYGCETWKLKNDLEGSVDDFGTNCLCRIMMYRWIDFVSNQRLVRETESRVVTGFVRERQVWLYEHVARLSYVNPAHRVDFVQDNREWRNPRGRPRNSWLRQVDRTCQDGRGMESTGA